MTDHDTDPEFARETFTLRSIKPWQITTLAGVAVIVVLLGLWWA